MNPLAIKQTTDSYINPDIIKDFANKTDNFNYKKLTGLLNELNDNYKKGNVYSCSQLLKGLVNHIPPLLGEYTSFDVAASQYSWERAVKPYITEIVKYIHEANDVTHTIISNRQDQATLASLPKSVYANTLLAVCLVESSNQKPIHKQGDTKPKPNDKAATNASQTSIEVKDNVFRWANWGGHFGSGFMGDVTVNNFLNSKNNFITKATISYLRADQTSWTSTTFKVGDNKYDAKVKIAANDMIESTLWLSDDIRIGQGFMEESSNGKGELEVLFADGTKCKVQVSVANNH